MKKAKLDLLEDISGLETEAPKTHQIPLDHEAGEAAVVGGRWALNKLLIIFAPLAVVILIGGAMLFSYLTKPAPSVSQTSSIIGHKNSGADQGVLRQKLQVLNDKGQQNGKIKTEVPETGKMVYLNDFIIDLTDSKGHNYVLMCDVAFDVEDKTVLDPVGNNSGLRNIIYRTAQSRSVVALRSVEERKKMKKELAAELGKMLGSGSVKNVYFTNYFIM